MSISVYIVLKVLISAVIIVAVSEIAKRSGFFGALLASLPLTSVLAMIWLYLDTGDAQRVAALSASIFWLVLPSQALFVVVPVGIRAGLGFVPSLVLGVLATFVAYAAMILVLRLVGAKV